MKEIFDIINGEKNTAKIKPKKLSYPVTEVESSKEINELLNEFSEGSLRRQKNFIVLLKCIALKNGKKKTTKADVEELKKLMVLLNARFTEI